MNKILVVKKNNAVQFSSGNYFLISTVFSLIHDKGFNFLFNLLLLILIDSQCSKMLSIRKKYDHPEYLFHELLNLFIPPMKTIM